MRTLEELASHAGIKLPDVMRHGGAHGASVDGNEYTAIFPANVGLSIPAVSADPQDPASLFLFPRLYEWTSVFGNHYQTARWVGVIENPIDPTQRCYNEVSIEGARAWNMAERFYDPSVKQKIVPFGMPVMMVMSWHNSLFHETGCQGGITPPVVDTTRPPAIWFYHWMDPYSRICQGLG